MVEAQLTGKEPARIGNAHRDFAPHGIYPAKGDDQWVAIVCRNDDDFQALCDVTKRPELARDARFKTMALRKQNETAQIATPDRAHSYGCQGAEPF